MYAVFNIQFQQRTRVTLIMSASSFGHSWTDLHQRVHDLLVSGNIDDIVSTFRRFRSCQAEVVPRELDVWNDYGGGQAGSLCLLDVPTETVVRLIETGTFDTLRAYGVFDDDDGVFLDRMTTLQIARVLCSSEDRGAWIRSVRPDILGRHFHGDESSDMARGVVWHCLVNSLLAKGYIDSVRWMLEGRSLIHDASGFGNTVLALCPYPRPALALLRSQWGPDCMKRMNLLFATAFGRKETLEELLADPELDVDLSQYCSGETCVDLVFSDLHTAVEAYFQRQARSDTWKTRLALTLRDFVLVVAHRDGFGPDWTRKITERLDSSRSGGVVESIEE